MKALPISEIHLGRRGLREVPVLNESFDVLICAGDIWEGQPEKAVQSVVDLARGKPAIVVPGNYDFYGHITSDVIRFAVGLAWSVIPSKAGGSTSPHYRDLRNDRRNRTANTV